MHPEVGVLRLRGVTTIRAFAALLSVTVAGCASPLYEGPSFNGRWAAEEVRLGRMTVEGEQSGGRVKLVLVEVDGRRLELSGAPSLNERRDGRIECEAAAGEEGVKVLFARTADDETPVGTMNFAGGDAVITFIRPHDHDGLVTTVHRASRPTETLRGIRLRRLPDPPPPAGGAAPAGGR
jgi:hypothetical protein